MSIWDDSFTRLAELLPHKEKGFSLLQLISLKKTPPKYNEKIHTQCHSCSRSIVIDPEGDPGQDGDEDGWHVGLQDEVTNVPLNPETQG